MSKDTNFSAINKKSEYSDQGEFIVNTWKLKNEGNLHAPEHYLASRDFQVDLLQGLWMKICLAIDDYSHRHCISYWEDSCVTFSSDGFPQYKMIAMRIADKNSKSEECFFKFNSAGSFVVGSSKHPLNIHPLVSIAYQVCIERRCGYIRDSDLISFIISDPDTISTVREMKG